MDTPHYSVEIAWSDADMCYVARCVDIPYCTAHGDTISEAAQEIQNAIQLHLESYTERGFPVPKSVEKYESSFDPALIKGS